MNILLVNDDGFNSEGIVLVESILKDYGSVYVVAPKEHQSGKGCSLFFNPIYEYEKVDEYHYKVNGTPAMCTMFGLGALKVKFDLVVSGCNYGLNMSCDTMYSGTVGACVEALFGRVPAIAVSEDCTFSMCKAHLREVLDYIFEKKLLSSEYMLNVNFPIGNTCNGIKITSMHPAHIQYKYDLNNTHFSYSRSGHFDNANSSSDVYAVTHGFISITPLRMNLYDPLVKEELENK